MIISHSRRFIFIKTKKTAGTSLEIALSKHCDAGDILTPLSAEDERTRHRVAGSGARNFTKGLAMMSAGERGRFLVSRKRPARFDEHETAATLRRMVGEDVWSRYFKFTVVRDPVDRFVSRYFWTRGNPRQRRRNGIVWDKLTMAQFLQYCPQLVNENWRIITEAGDPLVDDVAKYERLEHDLARVSAAVGLPGNVYDDMREIRTKSGYRRNRSDPSELLNEHQRTTIYLLCRPEYEHFGYEPAPDVARRLGLSSAVPAAPQVEHA